MRQFYFMILLCLLLLSASAFADTLYIKNLDISFDGRHIKDDETDVYFSINIFEKINAKYKRLELKLPRNNVRYTIINQKIEDDDENTELDKVLLKAHQYLFSDTPEKAYHLYLKALKIIQLQKENEEKVENTEEIQVYEGIFRFELSELLKNINNHKKNAKKLNLCKEFAKCTTFLNEYLDYILVKSTEIVKFYEVEISRLMQIILKTYRHDFFKTATQNNSSKLPKNAKKNEELTIKYQRIKAIYRMPYSTFALSSVCLTMNQNIEKLAETFKNAGLSEKDIEFIKADATRKIIEKLTDILQIEKLFMLIQQINCEKNVKNQLNKRITQFEQIWGKILNHEKVGKIVNADVFRYISENTDVIDVGIKSLNKAELELLKLINSFREEIGLIPLIVKPKTLKSATDDYMLLLIKMDEISHIDSKGTNPEQRAKNSGFKGKNIGENLYRGIKNANHAENVFLSWFQSADHLKNIISKEFDSCGVSKTGFNWCMLFGGP